MFAESWILGASMPEIIGAIASSTAVAIILVILDIYGKLQTLDRARRDLEQAARQDKVFEYVGLVLTMALGMGLWWAMLFVFRSQVQTHGLPLILLLGGSAFVAFVFVMPIYAGVAEQSWQRIAAPLVCVMWVTFLFGLRSSIQGLSLDWALLVLAGTFLPALLIGAIISVPLTLAGRWWLRKREAARRKQHALREEPRQLLTDTQRAAMCARAVATGVAWVDENCAKRIFHCGPPRGNASIYNLGEKAGWGHDD